MAAIPTYEVNGPNAGLTKFNEPRCQETHLFFGQCALAVGHEKQAFSKAHNPVDSRTAPTYTWTPRTSGPEYVPNVPPNAQLKIAMSSQYGKPQPDPFLSLVLLVLLSELLASLDAEEDKASDTSPTASKDETPDDRTMCWCGVNHGVDPPMDTEPEKPIVVKNPYFCDGCGEIHG